MPGQTRAGVEPSAHVQRQMQAFDRAASRACSFMERPTIFLDRLGKFALIPIGLLLLFAAAYSTWSTKVWLARAVEVRGSVIEMVRVRDSDDNGYLFTPLVRFGTPDGKTIEFQSSLRTNPPAYHVGQIVSVLYLPGEPHSAAIKGVLSLWFTPMVLTFIGSIFLAIGTAMVVLSGQVAHMLDAHAVPARQSTRPLRQRPGKR